MGNANARDPDYWNVPDSPGSQYYNPNWMQRFSDFNNVAELSVPGTHDTMARAGSLIWVWTQSLSLLVQLTLGVRFLDIRCRHYRNSLPIHHGSFFQDAYFSDVLATSIAFLEKNPSEVIFMRVKEEYDAAENTRTFTQEVQLALNKYPASRFWTSSTIPTLGQCRGKIVILDNFAGGAMGIPWGYIDLEDHWDTSPDSKWDYVRNHLNAALQSSSKNTLFITFSSFTSGANAPRELARSMDPKLHSFVRGKRGRLGIVAMDYPGPQLIRDIINTK